MTTLATNCPYCGALGIDFDQSAPPSDVCHHDPAEVVTPMARPDPHAQNDGVPPQRTVLESVLRANPLAMPERVVRMNPVMGAPYGPQPNTANMLDMIGTQYVGQRVVLLEDWDELDKGSSFVITGIMSYNGVGHWVVDWPQRGGTISGLKVPTDKCDAPKSDAQRDLEKKRLFGARYHGLTQAQNPGHRDTRFDVVLENGKYTLTYYPAHGLMRILRHGEPWQEICAAVEILKAKWFVALMGELEERQRKSFTEEQAAVIQAAVRELRYGGASHHPSYADNLAKMLTAAGHDAS